MRLGTEISSKIAAVSALAEAGSPFAATYADSRLGGTRFAQYGAADLGEAETRLVDRALAV